MRKPKNATEFYTRGNLEAARIVVQEPDKYPSLQYWAKLVLEKEQTVNGSHQIPTCHLEQGS
jgi:hypothetical protein